MKKKWNLYSISESRGILMGFATIIVAFFHCYHLEDGISNNTISNIVFSIRNLGNIGVDIFLFLSALGLYFSFSKDSNIKNFYKKRLIRIVPSILIVSSIYYLVSKVGFKLFIRGVTLISFYTDGVRDFWFFALLIVLYFLYPLLHKIIDKYKLKGLLLLLSISIGGSMLLMHFNPTYYDKIEIALTRIPVFLIGIYITRFIMNKKEIPNYSMILFFIVFLISNIVLLSCEFSSIVYLRYIYCALSISIIFLISFIHSKFSIKSIDKFLVYMGTYSMEVYLIFEKLCKETIKIVSFKFNNYFVFYMVMFIITIGLSFLLKKLCSIITKRMV